MLTVYDARVRQRDFLLEITRALTAQLDLAEVLKMVLHASVVMLAGEVGFIALRESGASFRVRATLGIDLKHLSELSNYLADVQVKEDGTLDNEILNDQLKSLGAMLNPKLRQSVALPLMIASEPLGLLVVFRQNRGKASVDDLQMLQSFADQAAIAVHNAKLYAQVEQERRRLSAILEHNADGIMILNTQLSIMSFNHALEKITGWKAAEALNQPIDVVFQWGRKDEGDLFEAIAEGFPFRDWDEEEPLYVQGDLIRKDGSQVSIGITYAPLFNRSGQWVNLIANVRDVTNFRRAQELQNIFVSTISHELRTPITLIKGYASTLNRDDVVWDPQTLHDGLTVIEEEADRLNGLVDNLLTTSKLQAQRQLDIHLDTTNLLDVIQRAVERLSTQSSIHQFSLLFPPDFPTLPADQIRIRQVMDNLLSNAIKYSPSGGLIEVGGQFTDDKVIVYVSDQGIGMSKADQEQLFQRFYRADSALSRKTQGTGLGLYLSKAIIEAHRGTMWVDSIYGQGSTFYFELPR
ncbi:MAG: ATP-binding protein [Phototrophicaceae bacterium]